MFGVKNFHSWLRLDQNVSAVRLHYVHVKLGRGNQAHARVYGCQ